MIHRVGDYLLRKPTPDDVDALVAFKNDPGIAALLGGFNAKGYSRADIGRWIEFHNGKSNEVLWAIVHGDSGRCVGHVGLYEIDHRIRSAEFAIMLGDRAVWGQGLGSDCTRYALRFGFDQLNLNRIHLSVLTTNARAVKMYERLGFAEEGRLRQAQYKDGAYIDVILMALLRADWSDDAP